MSEKAFQEAQRQLETLVVETCKARWHQIYGPLRPRVGLTKEQKQAQAVVLEQYLRKWANNTEAFIDDCGWAPDPVGNFGKDAIPEDLSPRGMVPIVMFKAQREVVRELDRLLNESGQSALCVVKSRQVALTTVILWWCLHKWLFRPSTTGLLGTYRDEFIDKQGKGERIASSLFGRLRMFLDAFLWCVPSLKFQSGKPLKTTKAATAQWNENIAGLGENDDVKNRLTRPRWIISGTEIFPGAVGNWIQGQLPSDSFGRSISATYAFMDELGQYAKELGAGKDHEAWAASTANTKLRVGGGTIPEGGGSGTLFYELSEEQPESAVLAKFKIHWSDIAPYRAGAAWLCPHCEQRNPWKEPRGPGRGGLEKSCLRCHKTTLVRYHHMTSPWFERQCLLLKNDPVAIARELQMDWGASRGDRLFSMWSPGDSIIKRPMNVRELSVAGFDPGQTMKNPGAWISARISPDKGTAHIVGYWMAAVPLYEYWVPFLKHWSPQRLERAVLGFGKYAGKRFVDAFDYPPEALEMLAAASAFIPPFVYGDKAGDRQWGAASPYDVLADYGVTVDAERTKEREVLVQNGIQWVSRMTIEPAIAQIRPPTPFKGQFPHIQGVFESAKPKDHGGQAVYKLDVDKQDPPYVNNAVDAWLYLCRCFSGLEVHAMSQPDGGWEVESGRAGGNYDWGDGFMACR